MKIGSPRQLKDWINNKAKKNNLIANTVLQNFMMERLLERISVSKYKENLDIGVRPCRKTYLCIRPRREDETLFVKLIWVPSHFLEIK